MELRMRSHRMEARRPDWTAAAVAGFVAGAILMVVELFWSTAFLDGNPWATSHKIAAMVLGRDALQATGFSVSVVAMALVTHYVLGILFGVVLSIILAAFHFDSSSGMVLLAGAVFGAVLYLFNFYVMVNLFSWFADMRGWATFFAHLIFGMAAAIMYMKLERA